MSLPPRGPHQVAVPGLALPFQALRTEDVPELPLVLDYLTQSVLATLVAKGPAGAALLLLNAAGALQVDATGGVGGNTLNTGQVAVGAAAVAIIAANTTRQSVTVKNTSVSPVWIGQTNAVTIATGHQIGAGGALTLSSYRGAIFGIAAGAGNTVTFAEEAP